MPVDVDVVMPKEGDEVGATVAGAIDDRIGVSVLGDGEKEPVLASGLTLTDPLDVRSIGYRATTSHGIVFSKEGS